MIAFGEFVFLGRWFVCGSCWGEVRPRLLELEIAQMFIFRLKKFQQNHCSLETNLLLKLYRQALPRNAPFVKKKKPPAATVSPHQDFLSANVGSFGSNKAWCHDLQTSSKRKSRSTPRHCSGHLPASSFKRKEGLQKCDCGYG